MEEERRPQSVKIFLWLLLQDDHHKTSDKSANHIWSFSLCFKQDIYDRKTCSHCKHVTYNDWAKNPNSVIIARWKLCLL